MKTTSLCVVAAAGLLLAPLLACSFSYSSKSISDSVKGSSDSSGSSSASSATNESRYKKDVEEYTTAFVTSGGGEPGSFLSGIGDLARKRGITDWEANAATWDAIGRGLGKAKVNEAQLQAYEQSWAAGHPDRQQGMQKGWEATH
jgi:hypothetical protein